LPRGFRLLDVALGVLFGMGIILFTLALILEAEQGGPLYMLLLGAGTMASFAATFVAAIKK
jgi:hypothetical protein